MNFHKQMQFTGKLVKSVFRKALITEAAKEAEAFTSLCGNLFQETEIEPGI